MCARRATMITVLAAGLAAAGLFASEKFNVRAFGAKGDGTTKDTVAVQTALDACARAGGGCVTVPPGTYLIGSVYLGDRTELHLEGGATLLGSPNLADYNAPDAYSQNWGSKNEGWSAKHLILALEKKGVSITGRGTIDGNGRAFFDDKPRFVGKVCWRDGGINARDYKNQGRPGQEIVFIECADVEVRDVTFRDMSCWSCFFHGCENVTVGGVTVRNGLRNLNTDGFDVDSCRNVRIGDCDIVTGDDAIAIRGSPARLKDVSKVCENVRVSNIVCRVSADGVRVGVGDGTIRDIRISDMRIDHAGRGLHVQCCYGKTPKKGVDISNVLFERISIKDVSEAVAVVAGSELSKATLGGIRFVGVEAETSLPMTIAGGGSTRVEGVAFENCTFRFVRSSYDKLDDHEMGTLSGRQEGIFYVEKASGVAFRNCRLSWEAGAMPGVTRAFSIHDAEAPFVDGSSHLPDRGDEAPIGVFDSGLGGLTVLERLLDVDQVDNATGLYGPDGVPDLARESFVYLGDQANMPYGDYSAEGKGDYLRELILKDTKFLLATNFYRSAEERVPDGRKRRVKIIVIACNTATAWGLADVRRYLESIGDGTKVVGVIEAGVRATLDQIVGTPANGARKGMTPFAVGVMATPGTIASGAYARTIRAELAARGVTVAVPVLNQGCAGLADAVEAGSPDADIIASSNLVALVERHRNSGSKVPIRAIILGCTHYPFVLNALNRTLAELRAKGAPLADDFRFVDPAYYTAAECHRILRESGRLSATAQRERSMAFLSVANPELPAECLTADGLLTRAFKYGRSVGSDAVTTKPVPFTRARFGDAVFGNIGRLLPHTAALLDK